MGAVIAGLAISHAMATCAGVAFKRAATESSAARIFSPRGFRYFLTTVAPRMLFCGIGLASVLAGQKARGEREIGHDADRVLSRHTASSSPSKASRS